LPRTLTAARPARLAAELLLRMRRREKLMHQKFAQSTNMDRYMMQASIIFATTLWRPQTQTKMRLFA